MLQKMHNLVVLNCLRYVCLIKNSCYLQNCSIILGNDCDKVLLNKSLYWSHKNFYVFFSLTIFFALMILLVLATTGSVKRILKLCLNKILLLTVKLLKVN